MKMIIALAGAIDRTCLFVVLAQPDFWFLNQILMTKGKDVLSIGKRRLYN
jgi:hypothetical protein